MPLAELGELNAFAELLEGKPSGSYRNILRAGFELDYVRANYLPTSGTA